MTKRNVGLMGTGILALGAYLGSPGLDYAPSGVQAIEITDGGRAADPYTEILHEYGIAVRRGDSLCRFARQVYGSEAKWKTVFDDNDLDRALRKNSGLPASERARYVFGHHSEPSKLPLEKDGERVWLRVWLTQEQMYEYARLHPQRIIVPWNAEV
ncbi:MAG: hypothetical protein HY518_03835 [Candidatus Aenigmarchaeota archaeon]|nr:hypothetical protein [Candidatus Aenigmarchaeota archaeon]